MNHVRKKAGMKPGTEASASKHAVKETKRKVAPPRKRPEREAHAPAELVEQMALLADANDAIIGYDADFRIVFWNNMAHSLYGYLSEEALGKVGYELLKPEYSHASREEFLQKAKSEGRFTAESIRTAKDGRRIYIDTHVLVRRDAEGKLIGYLAVDRDITRLKEREAQLVRLNRTLNALRHSGEAITNSKGEKEFLDEVCKIIVKDCGYAMMWIGYKEDDDYKSVRPVAYSGFGEHYLETLNITWSDSERGQGPTGTAVRTGKASMCKNMRTDPRFKPWREEATRRGYSSSLSIPFFDEKTVVGALTIYSEEPDPFTEDERRLLTELADVLAHGIKVIRLRGEREMIEQELRASEANANALVRYAPAAIYEIDFEQRRFISVNDAMIHMLGYSREELLSMDPSDLLDEESRARFAERIRKQLAGENIDESVEYRAFRKDGMEMHGLLNVSLTPSTDRAHRALVVAYDITEKKKNEEILRQSRENYRQLVEKSGSIILRVDKDMRVTFVNDFGLKFFGYATDELIGKRAVGTIIPERTESGFDAASMAEDILRHPEIYATNVHQNICKDGSLVWVSWANSPIYDDEGNLLEILSIGNDLSKQKEAEEALRKSESRFRLLSEIGRELLASDNPQDIVKSLCTEIMNFLDCQAFFNYLVDDSGVRLELNAYSGISDEEADKIKRLDFGIAVCSTVASGGSRIIAEDVQNSRDHLTDLVSSFGIHAYCSHPLKAQGKILGTLSFGSRKRPRFTQDEIELMRTVADQVALAMQRVKSENELIRHREHLEELVAEQTNEIRSANEYNRGLIECSLDPIVTISADGKVTDSNRAVELVTGVSRKQHIGSNFAEYFTEPDKAEEGYKRVLKDGIIRDYPLTIRHVSGRTTDVLYNATVYRNDEGKIQGVFAAARDVTEIRKVQDEQRRLIAELARSNTDLEQFAYVASHDLQEPLRMISSYTQLLARRYKDKLDSDANEFIGFAVDGALRLQALINSLLMYSRVGRKGNPFADVDCHGVVAEAIANLKAAVEESGASISADDLPVVYGDEMQLVQLFQNLISNSIKFRGDENPQIIISAERGDSQWVFSVADNGIGIEPQYHDRIFVIFQRLNPREKYAGTGMGLAICKKIVERHGGRIWFESVPGLGTTFFFTIPISKE